MMGKTDIWAVVPVKELGSAKSRLAGFFSQQFRREFARAMFEDVLDALARSTSLAGIAVVTMDAEVAALASRVGAVIFEDGARDGHTGAVTASIRRLARECRAGVLTLPGDIPGITEREVSTLCDLHGNAPAFSIVPSHDRRGSNAILMTPPDAVPVAFGDDSFLPHLDASRLNGIEPNIVELPGIALDIDHPADIALLLRRPLPDNCRRFLSFRGADEIAAYRAACNDGACA